MKNRTAKLWLAAFSAALLLGSVQSHAQTSTTQTTTTQTQTTKAPEDKSKRPSPPAKVSAMVGAANVTIDYSRPSMKGRKIFGGLEPYGKVWRTGANEATTFETSKDVKIEGQALPAGKYALFTIPGETEWTVIFNKTADQWGAFKYDAAQDALRVKVKPKKTAQPTEVFTINLDKSGKVSMLWENTEVDFTVSSAGKSTM
ncbi:DUF2911 domain-containing protein [Hymenobacter sp. BT491]|uniref:DUF2911 domain-containing protein n=1 Tax=Hymenobacter sp. BT491 TaxID=2766779 RepID=UPI0016536E5C|nr:DUF2911 domain-containing protein [Hymenobacter sp. BT491]MBC6989888.1 DUF2911 domain-containing protein [Hymenobacter sp. BT491]